MTHIRRRGTDLLPGTLVHLGAVQEKQQLMASDASDMFIGMIPKTESVRTQILAEYYLLIKLEYIRLFLF